MRYFAEIDNNNKVINVIQAEDEEFIKTLGNSYIETFESETVVGARAKKGNNFNEQYEIRYNTEKTQYINTVDEVSKHVKLFLDLFMLNLG